MMMMTMMMLNCLCGDCGLSKTPETASKSATTSYFFMSLKKTTKNNPGPVSVASAVISIASDEVGKETAAKCGRSTKKTASSEEEEVM